MSSRFLTVGQVADILGAPEWKVRRIVDSLDTEIPRAGLYRLVPRSMLSEIADRVRQHGCNSNRTREAADG